MPGTRGARPLLPEDDRGPIRASDSAPLLKALHLMNADGSISADMRRKFRQANRLVESFLPVLSEITERGRAATVVDANCGNAYVSFLLAEAAERTLHRSLNIHGIDRSEDRVRTCRERAALLGRQTMRFETGESRTAALPPEVDLLVSLHGCDTATDEAILRSVEARIPHLELVPCCQHELRPLLDPAGPFGAFLDDGIIAADFAATLTDVLRSLWLRTRGYRTAIMEFVPLEHSAKNRLLRAKFTRRRDPEASTALAALLTGLRAPPRLVREGEAFPPWSG